MPVSPHPSYPVYKGMQKPLEFMGVRGKFLYYAAGIFMGGFISFVAFNVTLGFLMGLLGCAAVVIPGLVYVFVKQKHGLHDKRRYKGIVHPTSLWKH